MKIPFFGKGKHPVATVSRVPPVIDTEPAKQITPSLGVEFGAMTASPASLIPSGKRGARSRQQIYDKWAVMDSDPVVSTAIGLLVTAALGGHETTGQVVFIEPTAEAKKDSRLAKIVDEINRDLGDHLNVIAHPLGCTAASFGDSFVRIYQKEGEGVKSLYIDELVRPQLVQPFERGGETVGYAVYSGERNFNRLDPMQMARVKLPRNQFVPQHGITEKVMRLSISEDDIDSLPIIPAAVGGSLLYNAEPAYDRLAASLAGMTAQRIVDSIQESLVTLNLENMTEAQQARYLQNVSQMLFRSQEVAQQLVDSGEFLGGRLIHALPVWGEKQMLNQGQALSQPRASTVAIDDVMFNAKMLVGSLGIDLSMVGWADILSGGLGEGGFFRVSAQVAERSRSIRPALSDCFDHIINVHCLSKYGVAFGNSEKPWTVNYYSTISALESERQRTATDAMQAGLSIVQSLQMLKELGTTSAIAETFLAKTLSLDDDLAKEYAKIMDAKPPDMGMGGGIPVDDATASDAEVEV